MSGQIFISFRDENRHSAYWLSERLARDFGRDQLLMNSAYVAKCAVLIAVIGTNWLTLNDESGVPRLYNPADAVRKEIATALKRGISVIPVLLDGASTPPTRDLPGDLQRLVYSAPLIINVRVDSREGDYRLLLGAIRQALEKAADQPWRETWERWNSQWEEKEQPQPAQLRNPLAGLLAGGSPQDRLNAYLFRTDEEERLNADKEERLKAEEQNEQEWLKAHEQLNAEEQKEPLKVDEGERLKAEEKAKEEERIKAEEQEWLKTDLQIEAEEQDKEQRNAEQPVDAQRQAVSKSSADQKGVDFPCYDVFISCKNHDATGAVTRDLEIAAEIYKFLTSKGLSVFMSKYTLERRGHADYSSAIDSALDSASVLIAIGTSANNLNSRWVRYEWDSFANAIRGDRKLNGRIFAYVESMQVKDLPWALATVQAFFSHSQVSLESLYKFIVATTTSRRSDLK